VTITPSREQLNQREYYRRTADAYDEWHTSRPDEHTFALEHILLYVRLCGAESVLDSGCGTGRALRFLRERAPDLRLHGNDPSADLLAVATERYGIEPELVDCVASEQLPYEDGDFDAVVATGVLHHVPEPKQVVHELIRVARRAVFISDANIYGQGSVPAGIAKLALSRAGLLRPVNWLRRGGHHWYSSDGDGIAYSYSAFDAVPALSGACDRIIVIPTVDTVRPIGVPLVNSSHVLVCGFKAPLSVNLGAVVGQQVDDPG
jgi:ubiquinone/menaquinone biosynthesis C-methylase UbiE